MAAKDYIIAVDCSTTAAKAIVWDKKGNVVAESKKTFPLFTPHPDWVEQRAEDWWDATAASIFRVAQQVDTKRIAAIGITHQRESFVPLNKDGSAVRNAMLWADTRAKSQTDALRKVWAEKIHRITGRFPNLYASNVKILWMRENEPAFFQQTERFVDVAAYLYRKLTGKFITTWPSACPTGILDISKRCWSKDILELLEVEERQFCELAAPGEIIGTLDRNTASTLGLQEGTPVVGGGGDGQCAALGAGVVEEEVASLNLGTAIVSGLYSQEYIPGDPYRSMCGCIPGTYLNETLIAAGTFTIDWFMKEFGDDVKQFGKTHNISPEKIFGMMAEKIEPGMPRLLMLPYWAGASAPFWDPYAKGVVIGWSESSTRAHLYRSILEGIAFEQKFLYEETEKYLNKKIGKIVLLGGGARSSLWPQIAADILGTPVFIPQSFESTCLGAAMLAAYGIGMYSSIQEASKQMSRITAQYTPIERNNQFYLKSYERVYTSLFPKIQELVDEFTHITLGEEGTG